MVKSGIERSQTFDIKFDPYVIMLRSKKIRDFAKYKYLNKAYLAYLIQKLANERTELTIGQRKVFSFAMQNFVFKGLDPTEKLFQWNISYTSFENFITSFSNYLRSIFVELKNNAILRCSILIIFNQEIVLEQNFILKQHLAYLNSLNSLNILFSNPEINFEHFGINASFNFRFLDFFSSEKHEIDAIPFVVSIYHTQNLNQSFNIISSITYQKV